MFVPSPAAELSWRAIWNYSTKHGVFVRHMRATVRYFCLVFSVVTLAAAVIGWRESYSRAFIRTETRPRHATLLLSHAGQIRWFSARLLDETWRLSDIKPTADSISTYLDYIGPAATPARELSSSDGVASILFSNEGGVSTMPLTKGYFPRWTNYENPSLYMGPNAHPFPGQRIMELRVPYWLPVGFALCCAALSGMRVMKHYRRQRWIASGSCSRCGYDLRATPLLCPECGLAPSPNKGLITPDSPPVCL